MNSSSQKSIAKNRAPRVQIVYDIEGAGEPQTVELPFVMGVMGDFGGQSSDLQQTAMDARFKDIDMSNFDRYMSDVNPALSLKVANELGTNSLLKADLQFKKIDDFNPDAVARQVPVLAKLLEAREKLSSLLAYMDGKDGAEALLGRILNDKKLLQDIRSKSSIVNSNTPPSVDSKE